MLASGRTGIVCKIVLLVSLLVMVTTLTLIMHAVMSNRRSLLRRTSPRHAAAAGAAFSKVPPPVGRDGSGGGGGGGGGGGRSERGLMALIANVTKTVIAMEMQATSLNDELKSMREKARELLMQQRHTALWTVLHKCVFLYSCKDQTANRGDARTPAQVSATPDTARGGGPNDDKTSGDGDANGDSVVSVQKIERKYSMYRLRRRS